MSRERTYAVHRHCHLELGKPMAESNGGKGRHAPKPIEELFAVTAGERKALTRLTGRVADAACPGKRGLGSLSALETREVVAQNRRPVGVR